MWRMPTGLDNTALRRQRSNLIRIKLLIFFDFFEVLRCLQLLDEFGLFQKNFINRIASKAVNLKLTCSFYMYLMIWHSIVISSLSCLCPTCLIHWTGSKSISRTFMLYLVLYSRLHIKCPPLNRITVNWISRLLKSNIAGPIIYSQCT